MVNVSTILKKHSPVYKTFKLSLHLLGCATQSAHTSAHLYSSPENTSGGNKVYLVVPAPEGKCVI